MNGALVEQKPELPATVSATPMDIMRLAVQEHVDADSLEKIAAMIERRERWDAERAFNAAMVACQTALPAVVKRNKNPQTGSFYAKLEEITHAIDPVIHAHGFSPSFGTDDSPVAGMVRVICDLRHAAGHCVRYKLDLPPDDKGIAGKVNKTLIHGIASTLTYGERYLTCLIFKVQLEGLDFDGNRGGAADCISAEDIGDLNDLINSAAEARGTMPAEILAKVLEAYEIESLDQLPKMQLLDARTRLRKQINAASR